MMCVANEPAVNEVYDPAVSDLFWWAHLYSYNLKGVAMESAVTKCRFLQTF